MPFILKGFALYKKSPGTSSSSALDHRHEPESNTGAMPVTSSVSTLRMMPKLR